MRILKHRPGIIISIREICLYFIVIWFLMTMNYIGNRDLALKYWHICEKWLADNCSTKRVQEERNVRSKHRFTNVHCN